VKLLLETVHQLLSPDVVNSCEVISVYAKGKNWEAALLLLVEMIHGLLTPDVASFGAGINACDTFEGKLCD